jgi:hypothetical protein
MNKQKQKNMLNYNIKNNIETYNVNQSPGFVREELPTK